MPPFDKTAFAKTLSLAKGDRSINKLGTVCCVDPGYISRLLRGLLDNAPSPALLKRIAAHAVNGVTYWDLMQAAGFLLNEELTDNDDGLLHNLLFEMHEFFQKHPDWTKEEKDLLSQEMIDYFRFKAEQIKKNRQQKFTGNS